MLPESAFTSYTIVIGVCRIRRSAREGEAPLTGDETTGASGRGEQVEQVGGYSVAAG